MPRDAQAQKAEAQARAVEEINAAAKAAEQVETTPHALMASCHDLRAIGVGHGDWRMLVQQIGGYGPSLQEAIVRLGALIARTLAKLATQSCSAVESLLRARGGRHTRDSHEFSMLRDVIELLRSQEAHGRLRGLAADGMIDRDPDDASDAAAVARLQAVRAQRYVAPPSMSGPVYTAYCAATAMVERVHAAAIVEAVEAVEAAEQVEATPEALRALLHDLMAIGVGHGDWRMLVQRIGGYGPSLQEAIVRLGACIARTRAALATQLCRAVESLLRARGGRHTRDSPEFSMLRDVIELLRSQEAHGSLRGLAADGMIDRDASDPSGAAAVARLRALSDAAAPAEDQSPTTPPSDLGEEGGGEAEGEGEAEAGEAEAADGHSTEVSYTAMFGERLGPTWHAFGAMLSVAAQVDPAAYQEPLADHARASQLEEQRAADFTPPTARRWWHPEMARLVQQAMRGRLSTTSVDCPVEMSLDDVRWRLTLLQSATEEPFGQALSEPQRTLYRLVLPAMSLIDKKRSLRRRGTPSARREGELSALAMAMANHLTLRIRSLDDGRALSETGAAGAPQRTRDFRLALVEPYPDDDSRSGGSWPQTFTQLDEVARKVGARAILFARRYGPHSWTLCIHLADDSTSDSDATSSAGQQLLLGAAVDGGGCVTPLPTRTARSITGALGVPLEQLAATGTRAPATVVSLDDNPAFCFALRDEHVVWTDAALDLASRSHKAGATQGERLRLARFLPPESRSADEERRRLGMPAGEVGFEGGRFAQSAAFSATQAASAFADVLASAERVELAPPPPFEWQGRAPPMGFADADALLAPFPQRDGISDPARDPAGPTAQRYQELLRAAAGATDARTSTQSRRAGRAPKGKAPKRQRR